MSKINIPLSIATTGFAGMIFELGLIFAFQTLYGYLYHWLGLLITAFMVGVAAGSLRMTSCIGRIKKDFTSFIRLELALILFSGILPLIFLKFNPHLLIFLVLSFISGLLVGAEFPLANKLHLKTSPNLSGTAGTLYASDLLGGWLGGMLGGVVLLSVLGLFGACMVVVVLKLCSFLILVTSPLKN